MEKYTMLDYIKETPSLLLNNIQNYISLTNPLINELPEKLNSIWLIASGSSYNACYIARSFMRKCLNIEIKVITPYTFTFYEHNINNNDLVCVITQSGLSTNAIEALQKIKSLNMKAICLTGNVNSDVSKIADCVIDYGVGEELVGYVTKGVTSLSLFLMLLAIRISNKIQYLQELVKASKLNEEMIDKTIEYIKDNYAELSSMNWSYCLGGGANYGLALEGSLKIGETIHIPSVAYEIEEYIHGPNLQLTPQYNIFIFDGNDIASARVEQIYDATKQITSRAFMVSNNPKYINDNHVLTLSDKVISEISPLVYLPFIQLISFIISRDTHRVYQHPLLKNFKAIAQAKTASFVNYDEDD